jgi:hypothetical protein
MSSLAAAAASGRDALVAAAHTSSGGSRAGAARYGALLAAGGAVLVAVAGGAATAHAEKDGEMILFSGNANLELAAEIATLLGTQLGNITVARFADGEVNVQVSRAPNGCEIGVGSEAGKLPTVLRETWKRTAHRGSLRPVSVCRHFEHWSQTRACP